MELFSMLCAFAKNMEDHIGDMLDRSKDLSRSFREETMTDILMGGLVALRSAGVTVDFPVEATTGADMEWTFVRSDGSTRFTLLIQAKRLYGAGNNWIRRSYPEIFHRVGGSSSGSIQSSLLVAEATKRTATFPLYLFYTHKTVRDAVRADGRPMHSLSFAGGRFIDSLVRAKLAGKLAATSSSNLGTIQPKLFPVSRLLCGPRKPIRISRSQITPVVEFLSANSATLTIQGSITPEELRAKLVQQVGGGDEVPPLGQGFPDYGYRGEFGSRYKVVFISPPSGEDRPTLRL